MPSRRPRRADVAREAGVSKTTVTYVLSDAPYANISDETKTRVKDAAQRLGYVPNFAASSLVRGRTEIVGLLMPSAARQFYSLYSAFLEGLVSASHDSPYNFLYMWQDQPEKYRRVLGQGFVDGMIMIQSREVEEHVETAVRYDRPLMCVNYIPRNGSVPAVSPDYEQALEEAYDWLIERGRKRICLFLVDNDRQPNRRQMDHHDVLKSRYGRRVRLDLIRVPTIDAFADAYIGSVGSRPVDGVVVEGNYQLTALVRILDQTNQTIGDDVDIVSMNIADIVDKMPSGIRVVESPSQEVGRTAWELMATLLSEGEIPMRTLIPFRSSMT